MASQGNLCYQGFIKDFYPGVEAPKNTYVRVANSILPETFGLFIGLRLNIVHSEQCTDDFYWIRLLQMLMES